MALEGAPFVSPPAVDGAALPPRPPLPPLLPRYRRRLSVSGVLDDTIQVFRQVWRRTIGLNLVVGAAGLLVLALAGGAFLAAGGIALVTAFAGLVAAAAGGRTPRVDNSTMALLGQLAAAAGMAVLVASVLGGVVSLAWYSATTVLTDWTLRGQRLGVWGALTAGLRRTPALIVSALLVLLIMVVTGGVSLAVLVLARGWSFLLALVALVGLVVWAAAPSTRQAFLKWLIVLTAPFGLPIYFSLALSLFVQAGTLERAGPVRALQRSNELISGRWFRVLAVWTITGIVVSILQGIPGAFIGALLIGAGGQQARTPQGLQIAFNLARIAGSYLGGLIFGALPNIASTLVFVGLRNEREGSDLAERLEQLDALAALGETADGRR